MEVQERSARSPLIVENWEKALALHPDRPMVDWIIAGFKDGFMFGSSEEVVRQLYKGNNSSAKLQPEVIMAWLIEELKLARVVELFPETNPSHAAWVAQAHVFPLGLAAKHALSPEALMKYRTTSDLTRNGVNGSIAHGTASLVYVTTDAVARKFALLPAGAMGALLDVRAAYRIMKLSPHEFSKCVFKLDGRTFVDTFLPFGVASGPVLYDQLGALLQWIVEQRTGISITRLLDDNALADAPGQKVVEALSDFRVACEELGVPVADDKLQFAAEVLRFLGLLWDFKNRSVGLPLDKWRRLRALLALLQGGSAVRVAELESVVGFLSWAAKVIRFGRASIRALHDQLRECNAADSTWTTLSEGARADVHWWAEILEHEGEVATTLPFDWFLELPPTRVGWTDSSGDGGGGLEGHDFYSVLWPSQGIRLDSDESSIAFMEMLAVFVLAVQAGERWRGEIVWIFVDNESIVQAWKKTSSPCPRLMDVIRSLCLHLTLHGVRELRLKWIPTKQNPVADYLSRCKGFVDSCLLRALAPGLTRRWIVPDSLLALHARH